MYVPDFSHYHRVVDPLAFRAAGFMGGIGKVSEAAGQPDRVWTQGRDALRSVGLPVGAYHFYRYAASPQQNAEGFLRYYGDPHLCHIPPVLDAEDPNVPRGRGNGNADALLTWLQFVEARTGQHPILYTGTWWWNPNVTPHAEFANYPLWLAAYSRNPPAPPRPWGHHTMWQFSSTHPIPGLGGGSGDCSVIDAADFNRLIGSPVRPPAPQPNPQPHTPPAEDDMTPAQEAKLDQAIALASAASAHASAADLRIQQIEQQILGAHQEKGDSFERELASLTRVEANLNVIAKAVGVTLPPAVPAAKKAAAKPRVV